jgi:hypothetical protein
LSSFELTITPHLHQVEVLEFATNAYWGPYTLIDQGNRNLGEFQVASLVVRYGHLYVLYGHLKTVDPGIYVGKVVNQGDRLGTIGTFTDSDPHLHIELHYWGAATPTNSYTIDVNTSKPNRWGLLKPRDKSKIKSTAASYYPKPQNYYDFSQFFSDDVKQPGTATAWGQDQDDHSNTTVNSTFIDGELGGWQKSEYVFDINVGFPCKVAYQLDSTGTDGQTAFNWPKTWANMIRRGFFAPKDTAAGALSSLADLNTVTTKPEDSTP